MKVNFKFEGIYIKKLLIGLMFGLILLPSIFKSVAILVFGLCVLIFGIKNKNKFNRKLFFLNASFYFFLIVTLVFSKNVHLGLSSLTTMSSLIVFPLLMAYLNKEESVVLFKQIKTYKWVYIIAVCIFNIFPFCWYGINESTLIEIIKHYPYLIIIDFGKYSIHPIYISMHCAIAILFSLSLFKEITTNKKKIVLLFIISLLVLFLLIYLRKGPIIALIFSLVVWSLINYKLYLKQSVILISCLVILVALIPNTRNRFLELINISNDKENAQSSTNIRYTIYKNSFKLVKNAPLLGYGIGDYNLVLKESYKKNASFLLKKQYNSHNQYLSFFLMGGFCLFLIFIFTYTKNIFLSIKAGNTMLILLLTFYGFMMLFENILERENGVIFFAFFINFFALKNYYNIEE
jgi:hypothetical protein